MGIGFFETIGDRDVDDVGEWGGVGTNGHVDNVRLIVSRRMIVGENEEDFWIGDDGDEHEQWPKDVTVLIIVKRRGICNDDDDEGESSFRRVKSSNNWSAES